MLWVSCAWASHMQPVLVCIYVFCFLCLVFSSPCVGGKEAGVEGEDEDERGIEGWEKEREEEEQEDKMLDEGMIAVCLHVFVNEAFPRRQGGRGKLCIGVTISISLFVPGCVYA